MKIRCLKCNDIIESKNLHDCVSCKCGACSIDGGNQYTRVELDKKWENCWTRKICICVLTYIVVITYSYIVRNYSNILLSSLVPVIGFTLSTLSLKYIRKIWEKNVKND